MAVHYKTKGFVIKKRDVGEADKIFTVFTEDFGKIKVLGRAIRKIASKLKSGIDMVSLSDIEFIQGRSYKTLTDAVLTERFNNIKNDLGRLKIAHKIGRVLDGLIGGEDRDEKIWSLANDTFWKLNDCSLPASHYALLYYYFLWNLFSILGYQPELYKCAACQKKLVPGFLYFSEEEGGVVCNRCTKSRKRINTDVVKILRIILKKDYDTLLKLKIQPFSQKLLKEISEKYYLYLLSAREEDFQRV